MRLLKFFIFLFWLAGFIGNTYAQYNFNVKRTIGETNHKIVFASYNSDGTYLVTAGMDSSIIIWNADRHVIYRTLTGLKARPNFAVFSDDNKYIFSGGRDNIISMWDIGTMPAKIIKTFEGHKGPVKSIAVSPNGKYLATGSTDKTIRIWDILSANMLYELKEHKDDINSVAFSPDGKLLASGGADGFLCLWNMGNGGLISSKQAHKGWVRDILFTGDGKLLASGGYDKLINLWQIPDLNKSATLEGHKDWVLDIDLSPDGKTLISGGRDKVIILWDIATRKILRQSDKQEQIVISVDISPAQPDFISSCYESEKLETWALTGLDESQWKKPAEINTKQVVADNIIQANQQRIVNRDQDVKQISQVKEPAGKYSTIEIFSPVAAQGRTVLDKSNINIIGRVSDPEGVNTFLINSKVVQLADGGVFQYPVSLMKGENQLTLLVINKKGLMTEQNLIVECTAINAPVPGVELPDILKSKYYALLIGINDYQDPEILDLENPIKDAESLYNILSTNYTFEKENIILLKNPTNERLTGTFDSLARKLDSSDNLLIFYAGHGKWDDKAKVGSWFPADASKNNSFNWFRNSVLRDCLSSIATKHTLLIADACFSGAIFKSRAVFTETTKAIDKLFELPSRKAMTSGILQEVPDESVFLQYLVKYLRDNKEKFLPSETLFTSFKTAVLMNSTNIPQYGVIQNVGDEGGDFIFIKR